MTADRPWLDAGWLEEQAAQGRSATDIAGGLGVPASRIRRAASSRGVTLPDGRTAPVEDRPWLDAGWLEEQAGQGRSAVDIAANLGVPASRIRQAARSRGVSLPRHRSALDAVGTYLDAGWLRQQAQAGRSAIQIADALGVPAGRIRMAAHNRGVSLPRHGSTPDASVTYLDAAWLREQVAQGRSARQIAADLGVPANRIRQAARSRGVSLPRPCPVLRYGVDVGWLQAQVDAGRTRAQIAADLGTYPRAVSELCRELGVRPRRSAVDRVLGNAGPGDDVTAAAWLVLAPSQKMSLTLFRVWLAAAGVALDQATDQHVLGYSYAEIRAGAKPGTVASFVVAVDAYDEVRRVPSRTGLARKLLKVRRRGLAIDPMAPAAPIVVLEPLMTTDPVRDTHRRQVSVCKATVIEALQERLGTDVAGVRASLRSGRVELGPGGTIRVDGTDLPAAAPPGTPDIDPHVAVSALERLGCIGLIDGHVRFRAIDLQLSADPALRTAQYRKWCVADAVLDVWMTTSFWHALRGGAAAGIPISRLYFERHNVAFEVPTKNGQLATVRIEHTPGHRMCHACAATRLTDLLDDIGHPVDATTLLADLPGIAAETLGRRVAAAGLPEGAVTLGTPRRTMATAFWSKHRNLGMLRLLLGHAPGSVSTHRYVSTTRYVEDLPELDLTNPDYDIARWEAGIVQRTGRRRDRHARRPAKDLPWSNPTAAAEIDGAVDAALEELEQRGLLGPPQTPAANEARIEYAAFVWEGGTDPHAPATLADFAAYEFESGLPVRKVRTKIQHILGLEEDPARRQVWRKEADRYLRRVEHLNPPDVGEQATLVTRAEILPWADLLPDHLKVMLIAGWAFALRPGSAAQIMPDDLEFYDDRVVLTVRGNTKRRSGGTYVVTVPTTGDALCPSRLATITPQPGHSLAGMRITDTTTSRHASVYATTAWRTIRTVLTDAGYTDAATTGLRLRCGVTATLDLTPGVDVTRRV